MALLHVGDSQGSKIDQFRSQLFKGIYLNLSKDLLSTRNCEYA